MNQILQTNLNTKNKNPNLLKSKRLLKFQLYFSIALIIFIGISITHNTIKSSNQEKYSKQILNNYNITKLYSNQLSNETSNSDKNAESPHIIGIIEISKINVYYPIFSNYNDELLKISPCRFYGPLPGKNGNLCIAGHNYDNDKFFSRISTLNINDEITIYDNSDKKFSYLVSDIYEVGPNDLSPVYSYDSDSKVLTLITCNNFNNNRIVVKAFNRN